MNKMEFRMAIPAVTQEYTPFQRRNSRNQMTHTPRREMRLDFPAFRLEQYRIPNETRKDPRFLDRTPESPKNTVTRRDEL